MRVTSSPGGGSVNSAQRRFKFLQHVAERKDKRRRSPDQHIVMARPQTTGPGCTLRRIRRQSYHLPQSPADAVALDGIAHLSRYGESDTHCAVVAAPTCLQNECPSRRPHTAGGGTKIAPPSQPLHGGDGPGVPITH
jgi:hypothetical protein